MIEKKTRIIVDLHPELNSQIEDFAHDQKMTKTNIVRLALSRFFNHDRRL